MFDGRFDEGFLMLLAAQDTAKDTGDDAGRDAISAGDPWLWSVVGLASLLPLAALAWAALVR